MATPNFWKKLSSGDRETVASEWMDDLLFVSNCVKPRVKSNSFIYFYIP